MQSQYSDIEREERVLLTLNSIDETIGQLIDWNSNISSTEDYYGTSTGMQLLAANCTLITAIGEGVNRINRVWPDFLSENFPETPWRDIVGMRNRIAHGYFELDADIVLDAVKNEIPVLSETIKKAIKLCKKEYLKILE